MLRCDMQRSRPPYNRPMSEPERHPRPASSGDPVECDLIMKGGITSGIVYPLAIQAFARRFRLRSIGGASAGAIAAAAAAAAEYGRRSGSNPQSFDQLARLPEQLAGDGSGGPTPLERLFQPEASTRALHGLLMSGLSPHRRSAWRSALRWVAGAAWRFPAWSLPALALAGVFAWAAWPSAGVAAPARDWLALAASLLCGLGLLLLSLLAGIARSLLRHVPDNLYGICTGMGAGTGDALTPWLHHQVQSLAGRGDEEPPLTFGDLWGGAAEPDGNHPRHARPWQREIDFRLMTTALSHGRPYTFPLEPAEVFHFRPSELRRLFPASVVDWLQRHARELRPERRIEGCVPLPPMHQLPVLVAVRMSLAFPVLLSAVPLYAHRPEPRAGRRTPERVWFADGGICSNFPVHFFDAVLPTRPTFAINLVGDEQVGPDRRDPADFVAVPEDNIEGQEQPQLRLQRDGRPSLSGLLSAIKDTMHNWNDNTQLRVPGFRDRIAQVRLTRDEGGLNLRMAPALIRRVAARGACAADTLLAHFFPPLLPPPGERPAIRTDWRNHRWVRFRTAAALFEESLLGLLWAERSTADSDASIEALHLAPPSYDYGAEARTEASLEGYAQLLATAAWFERMQHETGAPVFNPPQSEAPKPRSQLRIRPRL